MSLEKNDNYITNPEESKNDVSIDIKDLLQFLTRNFRLIGVVTSACILFSAGFAFFSKKVWEGEFQVIFQQ